MLTYQHLVLVIFMSRHTLMDRAVLVQTLSLVYLPNQQYLPYD